MGVVRTQTLENKDEDKNLTLITLTEPILNMLPYMPICGIFTFRILIVSLSSLSQFSEKHLHKTSSKIIYLV